MTPTPAQKLRRLIWFTFQASEPMGMGFLHTATADSLTETSVIDEEELKGREVYLDYHVGRMIKTRLSVDEEGKLSVSPNEPHYDYQSWASQYKTGADLIQAVEQSFA